MTAGSLRLRLVRATVLLLVGIISTSVARTATPPGKKGRPRVEQQKGEQKSEQLENADTTKPQPPPRRGRKQPPRRAVTPPRHLSLKYRIFKRESDGKAKETGQDTTFVEGEQIQLRVEATQDGYLYIIRSADGKDGELLFPHSGAGGVQNFLTRNEEYAIPQEGCEAKYRDKQGACWFPVSSASGSVWLTLYFNPRRSSLPFAIQPGGRISHQDIVNTRNLAGAVTYVGAYARQVMPQPKSDVLAAGINLNHETVAAIRSQVTTAPVTNPAPISVPLTPVGPTPGSMWQKLDSEYENYQATGLRLTVYKRDKDGGRESVNPGQLTFKRGDRIKFEFHSNFLGYVYIVDITPGGSAEIIFPKGRDFVVQPQFRYVVPVTEWLDLGYDKGTRIFQVVLASDRISQFEEAIKKQKPLLGQVEVTRLTEGPRLLPFDCRTFANVVSYPRLNGWQRRGVRADIDVDRAEAIVLLSGLRSAAGKVEEVCAPPGAEMPRGAVINRKELAVFEIRLKQE